MKKINLILKNIALIAFIIVSVIACETEFAGLDSDVINPDNALNFSTGVEEYSVITYNKKIGPVRTSGLSSNLLGYYFDPVFGTTTSNFVSQIAPTTFDPIFGENVVLDSVVLTIPYFSRVIQTDSLGNTTYDLDSIFGNTPIKFSVYKNNFFLRGFDPNSEFDERQIFFSNGSLSSTNLINQSELEGELLYQNNEFTHNGDEIILTVLELDENDEPVLDDNDELVKTVSSRLAPSIRVHLENPNDTFWQDLIFNKEGQPELSNPNNFGDHFRGIYLKAEATDITGTLMMLDFNTTKTNITLYYTSDTINHEETDTETTQEPGTFVLNFAGNQINIYDNDFINIPDGDAINGDEKLFLKGGEGSMAIINLFNGDAEGNSPEFEQFKTLYREGDVSKRLINEAFLEFYVDQTIVQGEEPERIFIYDLKNSIPLIDYLVDQSLSPTSTKLDHLVPLQRVDDNPNGQGVKYKIRITEHLNNLIIRDSTNVKLGLVVISNVASINALELQDDNDILRILPSGEVLSHRGTVLHGNNTSNPDKKVTFKIFYTEPDN